MLWSVWFLPAGLVVGVLMAFLLLRHRFAKPSDGLSIALYALGFSCGMVGFLEQGVSARTLFEAFYQCLQLIFLNVPVAESRGPWLSIARFALPAATAVLVFAVAAKRVRQWQIRLTMLARPPHIVVLGCGNTALRLATYFRLAQPSLRLLAIDRDTDSRDADEFRRRGFDVLAGVFEAAATLATMGLHRAQRIVLCTGDDERDLALARRILVAATKHEFRQDIMLSVDAPAVIRACRLDPVLGSAYDRGTLQFLNARHIDARLILHASPPHVFSKAKYVLGGKQNGCHIALYGSGELIDELAIQAVRALVYDPELPLRISVFVGRATEHERDFFRRFPVFQDEPQRRRDPVYGGQLPLAQFAFVESGTTQVDAHAIRRAHAACPIDVMYVMGETALNAKLLASETLKVVDTMDLPKPAIVACLDPEPSEATGSARSSFAESRQSPRVVQELLTGELPGVRLEVFELDGWDRHEGARAIAAERQGDAVLPDEWWDEVAQRICWDYEHHREDEVSSPEYRRAEATAEWKGRPHHEKWMNRYAADHAAIKLHLLDPEQAASSPADILRLLRGPGALDWLARLEHRRYVCERMTDGWLHRPGSDVSLEQHLLNPTLLPFSDLKTEDQRKDETIVKVQLLAALAAREARPVD